MINPDIVVHAMEVYSIIQATIEDKTMPQAEATTTSAIFAVKAIFHNQMYFDPSIKNRERKRYVLLVIKGKKESNG